MIEHFRRKHEGIFQENRYSLSKFFEPIAEVTQQSRRGRSSKNIVNPVPKQETATTSEENEFE
jgi:hypothetical protein